MVLLFFNCGVVDEMKVNVSGKLDINILNNKHRVSKNLPFYLVFLYYTSDLLLAIDDLVAHINSGATRKSFISKIDSIVQVRKNNFIYNKSYNTELKSGLILSIALKKFVELIYNRKDFIKLVCYFLDKEICKFPLTMGEFNSYRRTHPTHLSDSSLYYKFNALGNIFNHLNVFVHLLVAGNPALIAKQIEIRNSILQKNYREFYNFFASELNTPIEEVFFWCCHYDAKNKNKSSNPTPTPQANTSQQTPNTQANTSQPTPNTQSTTSQPTPNTQANTSQPTPNTQANTSQPTINSKFIDIESVFNIYGESCLKDGIDIIINNRDLSMENIIEKISIFTAPDNPFRTSNNPEPDIDGSILKKFLTELAYIIRNKLMFSRLICVYLDMRIYKNKSKLSLTPEEVINGLETNSGIIVSSKKYYIKTIKFLDKLFIRLPIFTYILQNYYIYTSKNIITLINNNDYNNLYMSLLTKPGHPIEKLFYWCHTFDMENSNTSSDSVNIQDVLNMYESSDLTPAEKLFQFCTSFDSETEVVKNDNSKDQNNTNNQNDSNSVVNEDLSTNSSVDNTNSQNKLKYKITTNEYNLKTGIFATTTLHQIEALIDIDCYNVKAGDLGGFIESESNLSHSGKCWVNDSACVYGNAIIQDNAQVYDNAHVYGNAKVAGNAQVYNNADVSDNVKIYNNVQICGNADLRHDVCVSDNVQVYDNACVCNKVVLEDNVWIGGSAHISNNSNISGNAWITGNARISGAKISDNVRVYGSTWILGNIELSGNVRVFDRAHIGYEELKSLIKLGGNTQVCGRTRLTS
jgi:carbonic anhydrase/acetyltransferase-like protein (isoleucine patch superfamily)